MNGVLRLKASGGPALSGNCRRERRGNAEEKVLGLVCVGAARVVICTASEALAERLRSLLLRWSNCECVVLSVEQTDRFPSPETADAHLVVLDMDTVEPAGSLQLSRGTLGLIVISKDAGRAIYSYRWHPAAFLKPGFDLRRLSGALAACERYWACGRQCVASPYRRRPFLLPLGRIRYAEASAHYCLFNQGKREVKLRFSINELEALLPRPPFARCHRSYIVHLDAVESLSYTAVTLRGGTVLPLGRTYIGPLRASLQAWRGGESVL